MSIFRVSSINIDFTLSKEILHQYMQNISEVLDSIYLNIFLAKLQRLILYQYDEVFDVHEIHILHQIIDIIRITTTNEKHFISNIQHTIL